MSAKMCSLDTIPGEILEHIAFLSGTQDFLGPPSSLPVLLSLNRSTNSALSSTSNPHLYARIFASKFDLAAPLRRLGPSALTVTALASELRSRCSVLKRIRNTVDCLMRRPPLLPNELETLDDTLWVAYFMMLENDGKNARQLRDYARIDNWLGKYWFHPDGASSAYMALETSRWPINDNRAALAMWLFWFFFDPGTSLDYPLNR